MQASNKVSNNRKFDIFHTFPQFNVICNIRVLQNRYAKRRNVLTDIDQILIPRTVPNILRLQESTIECNDHSMHQDM